jgi:hypothetical protein
MAEREVPITTDTGHTYFAQEINGTTYFPIVPVAPAPDPQHSEERPIDSSFYNYQFPPLSPTKGKTPSKNLHGLRFEDVDQTRSSIDAIMTPMKYFDKFKFPEAPNAPLRPRNQPPGHARRYTVVVKGSSADILADQGADKRGAKTHATREDRKVCSNIFIRHSLLNYRYSRAGRLSLPWNDLSCVMAKCLGRLGYGYLIYVCVFPEQFLCSTWDNVDRHGFTLRL